MCRTVCMGTRGLWRPRWGGESWLGAQGKRLVRGKKVDTARLEREAPRLWKPGSDGFRCGGSDPSTEWIREYECNTRQIRNKLYGNYVPLSIAECTDSTWIITYQVGASTATAYHDYSKIYVRFTYIMVVEACDKTIQGPTNVQNRCSLDSPGEWRHKRSFALGSGYGWKVAYRCQGNAI